MTTIYLTGTRNPGTALPNFLPDFIEMLLHQGHRLITSNKRGVDEIILQHCNRRQRPLHVCEFLTSQTPYKREVQAEAEQVSVRRIYSPTWQRLRYITDNAEKMIFFHAAKTRGRCERMPTIEMVERVSELRDLPAEQYIVQHQGKVWLGVQELRESPCLGTVHLYLSVRQVAGLSGRSHHIGYYRIETWRQIASIVQPGVGRREIIIPDVSRACASLHTLHEALSQLVGQEPYRLVIHYHETSLPRMVKRGSRFHIDLVDTIRQLLAQYPQVGWQKEAIATLHEHIGQPIHKQQQLWNHKKAHQAAKGLYH